jgi:hypothetical protein
MLFIQTGDAGVNQSARSPKSCFPHPLKTSWDNTALKNATLENAKRGSVASSQAPNTSTR